jgi:hypothetical protein
MEPAFNKRTRVPDSGALPLVVNRDVATFQTPFGEADETIATAATTVNLNKVS